MYVVDAIRKRPYRDPATGVHNWRPPYPKSLPPRASRPPEPPRRLRLSQAGNPAFSAATAYASARCAPRDLGILPRPPNLARRQEPVSESSRSSRRVTATRRQRLVGRVVHRARLRRIANPRQPYCENLDVIAHEMGHIILKHVIRPNARPAGSRLERRAHDEAGADLVSLVTVLHLDRVVDTRPGADARQALLE